MLLLLNELFGKLIALKAHKKATNRLNYLVELKNEYIKFVILKKMV